LQYRQKCFCALNSSEVERTGPPSSGNGVIHEGRSEKNVWSSVSSSRVSDDEGGGEDMTRE
jgi:hypothetical protein